MSLPKDGRNFRPESGKEFPAASFATAVAAALHREYDQARGGIAAVVALTGANQRTVRNWFEAKNGPGGEYLIALCRHSDEVLGTVLALAGRPDHARALGAAELRSKLADVRAVLLRLEAE
jgi:hypothetical protein